MAAYSSLANTLPTIFFRPSSDTVTRPISPRCTKRPRSISLAPVARRDLIARRETLFHHPVRFLASVRQVFFCFFFVFVPVFSLAPSLGPIHSCSSSLKGLSVFSRRRLADSWIWRATVLNAISTMCPAKTHGNPVPRVASDSVFCFHGQSWQLEMMQPVPGRHDVPSFSLSPHRPTWRHEENKAELSMFTARDGSDDT